MDYFPPVVQSAIVKMSEEEKLVFKTEYYQRRRSKVAMIILAVLFPIQLILLGKAGLWFAFVFTGGGLGLWRLVEIFLTPSRVDERNGEIATEIIRNIKTIM